MLVARSDGHFDTARRNSRACYHALVRSLAGGVIVIVTGCPADHHGMGADGGTPDVASLRCAADPSIEFCDDFETALQQVYPWGFESFPADTSLRETIIAGVPGNALQIDSPIHSVDAYGRTPFFPMDGTSSELVLRFDVNVGYYGIRVAMLEFDGSNWELHPSMPTQFFGRNLAGDHGGMAIVNYPFFKAWVTFEIHMVFDPTNLTFSVAMAPQGSPPVTVIGPIVVANNPPPTRVRAYLGTYNDTTTDTIVSLDNITLDLK